MYKVLKTVAGSNNGIDIIEYKKDEIIEDNKLCEYLAKNWLKNGVIEEYKVKEEKTPEPEEEKRKFNRKNKKFVVDTDTKEE